MNKESKENTEYYIVEFLLSNTKYITLWYTSDQDGFVLNEEASGIRVFKDEQSAQKYSGMSHYDLHNEITVILCDKLKTACYKEIDCNLILSFWNIVSDVASSLNIQFLGDRENTEINGLYEKLFFGCNLPAIVKDNEFIPIWEESEKKVMDRIIKEGIEIVKEGLDI